MPAFSSRLLPALRIALSLGGRVLLVLYFVVGALILVGREWILPDIDRHRARIEQQLTTAIGLPVRIAALKAHWRGWHPHLTIEGFMLADRAGQPALTFDRVEADIGWSSLWRLGLYFHRLEFIAPELDIRRDPQGQLFIAGLAVNLAGESDFADWLLAQRRIVVRDAKLIWRDERRGAPPLELDELNFELRNTWRHHDFGLTAIPPASTAARLDLRGALVGHDPADWASWRGQLYADLAELDFSAWRPWLDLPFEWTHGRGSARLWLQFANLLPTGVTAELHLNDVLLRLAPNRPALDLDHLDGRLAARRSETGFEGEIRRLTLATRDGIALPPTDVRLHLDTTARGEGGRFFANGLDLGVLAALADRLPLSELVHQRLQHLAPRGRLLGLEFDWRGALEAPTHWRVKGGFEALALAAWQALPGIEGLSGSVTGDDEAGQLRLASQGVGLALPGVFAEARLMLANLEAEGGWRRRRDGIELSLARATFRNADAEGEAAGVYRYTGAGPGEIDLSAKLGQATGSAVWRYLPLVVNRDARDWLKNSLVGGHAEEVTLRLKGPLAEFPFRDGKRGLFQVKGKIRGARLAFAPGWPEMTGIDGELAFEGVRMLIHGRRAEIMGVALSGITAEIPDLEAHEEMLLVKGSAQGATQRFLDFIEASPVGERIDHFTAPMRATGNGQLELALTMPLRRVAATQVEGRYRFTGNELKVLPELPPFLAAQGELAFTAERLQAKGLRARWLGMPTTVDVTSLPGGGVRVNASGRFAAQWLRQEYAWPALEHLSGETPWRASVTVKKPTAEVRIESTLEGLSSSLPDPFNKSALTALPLSVSGRIDPRGDEWLASVGEVAVLRLGQAGASWRGRIALGAAVTKTPPALPTRGVLLTLAQSRLDVDAWRKLMAAPPNGLGSGSGAWPEITAFDIKSEEVQLAARRFHDLRLTGTQGEGRWRLTLECREAQGQLAWEGAGAGRISGRLGRLHLPATTDPVTKSGGEAVTQSRQPPAIDLTIDSLRLRDLALGEARVSAENREGVWQAKLELKNEAARLVGEGRKPRLAAELELAGGEGVVALHEQRAQQRMAGLHGLEPDLP
ncbi:MAG: YhdP family protein, partial [Rhodocyclaceae bacterium]|nr:YhdP family protein [Rhodocyclaceae bacterium]